MKTLIVLSLLFSSMASAITLKTADLAPSHARGAIGVAGFLEAGGWRSQGQRQQQQHAQQQQCNVRQNFGTLWYYSETFDVEEVLKAEKFISKRGHSEVLLMGTNELTRALTVLIHEGAKTVRLSCEHSHYEWTFWEYVGNSQDITRSVDEKCLKKCEENRAPQCGLLCTRAVSSKACEVPSYIGDKGVEIFCELTNEE